LGRGDIWTVGGGKDDAGRPRAVVIVQDDSFDATDSITIRAFTTDETDAPLFRPPAEPSERNGLRAASRLMGDKITTVPKTKVGARVGRLDDEDILRLTYMSCPVPGRADASGADPSRWRSWTTFSPATSRTACYTRNDWKKYWPRCLTVARAETERRREPIAELTKRATETGLRLKRLYDAIENGVADLDDPAKDRIAGLKSLRDQAQADRAQAMAESAGQQTITTAMVQKFASTARERIRIDGGGYRREHLRALAQRVEVADKEVRIIGSKGDLLRTLAAASGVRSSVPRWRTGWDSNPRWASTHGGFQDRCLKPLGHPSVRPSVERV
jgi:mRNA-degrading endonuclease toxin of MazEF toxin-antitoxin module